MTARRPLLAAATLTCLLAAGCGSATEDQASKFSGEPKAVATTIDDLQDAGSRRDADDICKLMSAQLIARIRAASKQSCNDAVKESLKDVDAFKLEVEKNGITISGTTATAKVRTESGTKDDREDTLQLVKEDQREGGKTVQKWKLSALAG